MDKKPRNDQALFAPGAAQARSYRLPGAVEQTPRQRCPAVDDRLVEPETRNEMVSGKAVYALPAEAPHADRQCQLGYVVRARVGKGYIASTELLTRTDHNSDFATDACVRKAGTNPKTGGRFLEELSFEVASSQTLGALNKRAKKLMDRGVRRLFAILVREGEVREWSPRRKVWDLVDPESAIADKSLDSPLPVKALLDAAAADRAVAEALWAKREPFLVQINNESHARGEAKGRAEGEAKGRAEGEAKGRAEGEAKGRAEALLQLLALRGLRPEPALRQRILACRDSQRLDRWFTAAVNAGSTEEIFTKDEAPTSIIDAR